MKTLVSAMMFLTLVSAASASAQASPAPHRQRLNSSAVWRVGLSDGHTGTGVAVTTDGYVITTAELINRCPDCAITVGDDEHRHHSATLVAMDLTRNLAVLRTTDALDAAVTLWEGDARRGMSVYCYSYGEGWDSTRRSGTVRSPSLDVHYVPMYDTESVTWRGVMTTTLTNPSGSMGSGVFSGRDGRMLGILVGTADGGDGVIIPAATIRSFLSAHGVSLPSGHSA